MTYNKALPSIEHLEALAALVESFPISGRDIYKLAKKHRFGKKMMNFIELFTKNSVFESVDDFMMRAKNLELLIDEEHISPYEIPRTPQG